MNEYKLSASLEEHDDDVKCKPFDVSLSLLLRDIILGARSRFPTSRHGLLSFQRLHSPSMEIDISESSKV